MPTSVLEERKGKLVPRGELLWGSTTAPTTVPERYPTTGRYSDVVTPTDPKAGISRAYVNPAGE